MFSYHGYAARKLLSIGSTYEHWPPLLSNHSNETFQDEQFETGFWDHCQPILSIITYLTTVEPVKNYLESFLKQVQNGTAWIGQTILFSESL